MHLWRRKKSELMNLLRVMIWCKLKKKVKKGRVQKRVSSTEGNPSKYKFPYNELVVWSEWMSCHAFVGENDFFIRSFVKIFSLDFSSQVPLLITPAVSKIKKKKSCSLKIGPLHLTSTTASMSLNSRQSTMFIHLFWAKFD